MSTENLGQTQTSIYENFNTRSINPYSIAKRATDICLAGSAILALAPLMVGTAICVALESSGPVLFQQIRVGKDGVPFSMWKFRSMHLGSEAQKAALKNETDTSDGVRFKMANDPRITKVGKIIRKFSIDELPQLFNVLNGTMSLVGPRPAVPDEVASYTPWQRLRLKAKPGITCIWQVSGRSDIPFLQQVNMDIKYIRNASLILDLKLLLKTVPAVLLARGAH